MKLQCDIVTNSLRSHIRGLVSQLQLFISSAEMLVVAWPWTPSEERLHFDRMIAAQRMLFNNVMFHLRIKRSIVAPLS